MFRIRFQIGPTSTLVLDSSIRIQAAKQQTKKKFYKKRKSGAGFEMLDVLFEGLGISAED
jgi:hypothetical protein